MGLKESHISQHELYIMSGRTIDERYESQTVFMAGIMRNVVMERKLNGFIHKEKDKLKMRKNMCDSER